MALPTPPNSSKETLQHSFDDVSYPSLFDTKLSPVYEERSASPTDFLLRPSRKRSSTPFVASDRHDSALQSDQRAVQRSAEPSQAATKKRRIDSGHFNVNTEPDFSLFTNSDAVTHPRGGLAPTADFSHLSDQELFATIEVGAPLSSLRNDILVAALDHTSLRTRVRHLRGTSPPSRLDVSILMQVRSTMLALQKEQDDLSIQTLATPGPSKRRRTQKTASDRVAAKVAVRQPKTASPPAARSRLGAAHSRKRSDHALSSVKAEAKSHRQPANKPAVSKKVEDWPDYSPSSSVLDGASKIGLDFPQLAKELKDFSNDDHFDKLHPVEVEVTRNAAIDPTRYLVTKRSVFVGHLKYLLAKKGKRPLTKAEEASKGLKSWNKTAAQNCSSIDVNKTSNLFEHFWNKAGLFDEMHFQKYLDNPKLASFPDFDKDGNLIKD